MTKQLYNYHKTGKTYISRLRYREEYGRLTKISEPVEVIKVDNTKNPVVVLVFNKQPTLPIMLDFSPV